MLTPIGEIIMTTFLSKEIREGLERARKLSLKKKNRLRVETGERSFPVLRFWEDGFALEAEDAPHLRGLVDLYDGARHLYQCLIVASSEEEGEMRYEFKWHTAVQDRPPLDFVRDDKAPVALIGR